MPNPDRTLDHLTLNTGHRRASPRGEVYMDLVQFLAWLRGPLPFPNGREYRCLFVKSDLAGFATATLLDRHDYRPHVTMHVCWDAAHSLAAWHAVEATVTATTAEFPEHLIQPGGPGHAPVAVPWLAVLLWPTVDPTLTPFLGDFERCLAWALIEEAERAASRLN